MHRYETIEEGDYAIVIRLRCGKGMPTPRGYGFGIALSSGCHPKCVPITMLTAECKKWKIHSRDVFDYDVIQHELADSITDF